MAKPKVLVEPDVEAGSRLAALLLEAANKMPHGGSSGGDEVRWEARNKILPRGRQHASAVRRCGGGGGGRCRRHMPVRMRTEHVTRALPAFLKRPTTVPGGR
jgi:hypothetical protein